MSDHSTKPTYYVPKDAEQATHVYIKLEKPSNLGVKYSGPHVIVDRPSTTTATIRTGYFANGRPRHEIHSWNN